MNPVPTHAGVLTTLVALSPVLMGMLPPQYALYIAAASGCAAQIAAVLPPAKDPNSLYGVLRGILDVLAHNYGGAANKPAA